MLYEKKLNDDLSKFESFRLCYIDEIPETYFDYDEISKKLIETDEYKEYDAKRSQYFKKFLKRYGHYSTDDLDEYDKMHDPDHKFKVHFKDYDTDDYVNGYTHYLYFTSDIENQWGDDWDDAPYEYNAGAPYYDKTDILRLPIILKEEYAWLPNSYFVNSPYSVSLINEGVVPWIFIKQGKLHTSVMGGDTLKMVLKKLEILDT